MHEEWEIRSLPREENPEKAWRNLEKQDWSEMRVFGREKWESYRERDRRKWEADRTRRLYRPSVKLDRCRYREVSRQLSRKVSRKWSSTNTGIEGVSRNNPSNARTEARSIHQLLRSYRGGRSFLDLSTKYRKAVEIAIWKSLRSLIHSKVSRRCQGGVELAFKTSFSRCEKHRHECNPTCNSTNDPINILSSQNHLSIKILSTWISKTYTHTKQVWPILYFKNKVKTV